MITIDQYRQVLKQCNGEEEEALASLFAQQNDMTLEEAREKIPVSKFRKARTEIIPLLYCDVDATSYKLKYPVGDITHVQIVEPMLKHWLQFHKFVNNESVSNEQTQDFMIISATDLNSVSMLSAADHGALLMRVNDFFMDAD